MLKQKTIHARARRQGFGEYAGTLALPQQVAPSAAALNRVMTLLVVLVLALSLGWSLRFRVLSPASATKSGSIVMSGVSADDANLQVTQTTSDLQQSGNTVQRTDLGQTAQDTQSGLNLQGTVGTQPIQ